MGETSTRVSALAVMYPLPPTPSKRRGRRLSRVESLQDLRMRKDRDIRHRSSLDEPATSRAGSRMTKRAHSKCRQYDCPDCIWRWRYEDTNHEAIHLI